MVAPKTARLDLERARRHVAKAEQRVERELIERMARDGDSETTVNTAQALLRTFEQTLATMRFHLKQEESSAKRGR
ncbi:MAG TPA: hypothetical protein VFR50_15070 [Casimicrobiaceae bacterium]|jgi:hypothetical protein|nr:hypothetical protein [Casimicrobiaceae bacterium]